MSDDKYTLCKKAGLRLRQPHIMPKCDSVWAINAEDVEAFLAKAPVVGCYLLKESNLTDEHGPGWVAAETSTRFNRPHTHTARLVMIEPLQRDTAESLLRELANWAGQDGYPFELQKRAKKLLENK